MWHGMTTEFSLKARRLCGKLSWPPLLAQLDSQVVIKSIFQEVELVVVRRRKICPPNICIDIEVSSPEAKH